MSLVSFLYEPAEFQGLGLLLANQVDEVFLKKVSLRFGIRLFIFVLDAHQEMNCCNELCNL